MVISNVLVLCDLMPRFISPISTIKSISPGAVKTEIFTEDQLEGFEKAAAPFLNPSDISDAILYVLGTPPHVQVNQLFGSHFAIN